MRLDILAIRDDMRDARSRWWPLEELTTATVRLHPSTPLWMLHRAVVLYRVWHDQPPGVAPENRKQ